MSTVTDTDILTKPVNVIFTRRFLERARYRTSYFAGTQPATIARRQGSATAFWRRHEHLTPTTTPLTELNTTVSFPTRTATTPTITDITQAVQKYGDHIVLNEEADVFNFNGQTAELLDILADQAGRSLNQVQRNEMEDNSTLVRVGGAASDGAVVGTITRAELREVINTLHRNVAETFAPGTTGVDATGTQPILRAFWGICHPDVAEDVSQLTGFKSVETYAGQVDVVPGEFGFFGSAGMGIRFLSDPDASVDTGAGGNGTNIRETTNAADLYTTVIYGQNAVGSLGLDDPLPSGIVRTNDTGSIPPIQIMNMPFGSAGAADPLMELSTLGWKAWAAGKILNTAWIRGVRSAATIASAYS